MAESSQSREEEKNGSGTESQERRIETHNRYLFSCGCRTFTSPVGIGQEYCNAHRIQIKHTNAAAILADIPTGNINGMFGTTRIPNPITSTTTNPSSSPIDIHSDDSSIHSNPISDTESERPISVVSSSSSTSSRGKKAGNRTFRITGFHFAITYPKCPIEKSTFTDLFKTKFQPDTCVVAREQHEDGSYHFHVYAGYNKCKDIRSQRYYDITFTTETGEIQTFHPNIQKVKNVSAWKQYITKGDDWDIIRGDGIDPRSNGMGIKKRSCSHRDDADPDWNVLDASLGTRKGEWNDHVWSDQYRLWQSLTDIKYPIVLQCTDGFKYEMQAPNASIKKRHWWIVAPPNTGKTRWVNYTFANQRIYFPRLGKYPYEGYRNQDIIIYDDRSGVTFDEFSDACNVWNIPKPIYGEVRFTTQDWKIGHARNIIVLSNLTIEEYFQQHDWSRMKKRFIQIVNPTLMDPADMSDDEYEIPQQPEIATAAAAAALAANPSLAEFITE